MFSERFRELRLFETPKLNHTELGKRLKMTQRKISRLETGATEPTTDELVRICRYYNVSADYLLGLTDEYKTL